MTLEQHKIWQKTDRMSTLDDEGEQYTIEEMEALRSQVLDGIRNITVELDEGGELSGNIKAVLVRSRIAVLDLANGEVRELNLFRKSTRH